jgi:uncharacterized protein
MVSRQKPFVCSDFPHRTLSIKLVPKPACAEQRYPRGVARIEGYEFGRVLVDGEVHRRDAIVLPHRVVSGWPRREGHGLVLEDLDEVLDELPARLVVGTGAYAAGLHLTC